MHMNKKLKLILGLFSLVLISYVYWYSYNAINSLTDHFVEMDAIKSKFIVDLIKENYEGITSITTEQKNTAISNFSDKSIDGAFIKTMRNVALLILHPAFIFFILLLATYTVKIYRKEEHNKLHQQTPKSGAAE